MSEDIAGVTEVEINPRRKQREQEWQQLEEEFREKVVDKLGAKIEEGILTPVVGFNALGLETYQSCEGHLEEKAAYPWINFKNKHKVEIDTLSDELKQLDDKLGELREAGRHYDDHETVAIEDQFDEKLKQLHKIEEEDAQPIVKLLAEFNALRQTTPDQRLIMKGVANRIASVGAEQQKKLDIGTRKANLQRYREEMNDFGSFLKERFMSS